MKQEFDASGNATLRGERVQEYGSLTTDDLASYDSADEKLSLVSRQRGFSALSDHSHPVPLGV